MTHNTLYERFVDNGGNEVQGFIAYGLYKNAKREWVIAFKAAHDREPTANEIAAYVSTYTDQTIATYETQAAAALAEFAEDAVENARPEIVEEALRGSFWASVGQSIFANALYTLVLVALVLVLAFAGVDIEGVYQRIVGK